ncbi:MAG: leucine-rich repeat domain-containing protein [Bacteroidales bacterium]|nr:leucine-rich repeat domain-containing protein [Bacteroidales bacterium]
METGELYSKLKDAYTTENLGLVSGRIIEMFRDKKHDALRAMQKVVNEYTPCNEEKVNKIFSRLIMLYHPDRLRQNLVLLEKAYKADDFESLYSMSHILTVQNLEPGHVALSSVFTEEDLAEEFGWDDGADGFSYFMAEEELEQDEYVDSGVERRSFLSVLKRRVYGNLNVDFPMYLLEDLEEIEMADYELEDLDGISACHYARAVDLSNNNLTDISELGELRQVERLYLSNNQIGLIDVLNMLSVLQVLDISYNDVDDISPLFELNYLSYLNVMGNRIPAWQLEKLQLKGVSIVA